MESVKIRKQPHHLKLEVPVPRSRFWINEVPEVCELSNESAAGMDLDFIAACNPFFPTEFNIDDDNDDDTTPYCRGVSSNKTLGDAEELFLVPVPAPPPPPSSHDTETADNGLQPRPLRVATPPQANEQARLSMIIRDTLREYQDLDEEEDNGYQQEVVLAVEDEYDTDDEPCCDLTDDSEAASLSSRTTVSSVKESGLLRNQIEDLQDEMEQLRAENARMAEQLRDARAANDSLLRRRNTAMLRSASMTDRRPRPSSFPAAPQQIPPGAEQIHDDFTFLYAKLKRHGDLDTDVCWLAARLDTLGVPMNDSARVGLMQTLDEVRDRLRPHVEAVLDREATRGN